MPVFECGKQRGETKGSGRLRPWFQALSKKRGREVEVEAKLMSSFKSHDSEHGFHLYISPKRT